MTSPDENFRVFLPSVRQKLIVLLDPEHVITKDWRHIAEHLGLDMSEIKYLSDQKGTARGPTEHVLRIWENTGRTLQQFVSLMHVFQRNDVVAELTNA